MKAHELHTLMNMLLSMKFYFKQMRHVTAEMREIQLENALRISDAAINLVQQEVI